MGVVWGRGVVWGGSADVMIWLVLIVMCVAMCVGIGMWKFEDVGTMMVIGRIIGGKYVEACEEDRADEVEGIVRRG